MEFVQLDPYGIRLPVGGCLPPDQGVPGMAPSIALRDGGMMTELWPCTSPARTQKAAIIVTRSRVTDGEVEDGGWMVAQIKKITAKSFPTFFYRVHNPWNNGISIMAGLDRKRGADFIAMLQELGGKVCSTHTQRSSCIPVAFLVL